MPWPLSAFRGLELYCLDLAEQIVDVEPVHLVHAALIFEHAGIVRCLENAVRLVAAGGALSVVLELARESHANVVPTTFASIAERVLYRQFERREEQFSGS
jgi:hypothetical protein